MTKYRVESDICIITDIVINTPLILEPSLQESVYYIPRTTLGTRKEIPQPPYQIYK